MLAEDQDTYKVFAEEQYKVQDKAPPTILTERRAKEKVLAENGRMFVGNVMPLSLSCDHRVVDGAEGARFLNTVVWLLENPTELID